MMKPCAHQIERLKRGAHVQIGQNEEHLCEALVAQDIVTHARLSGRIRRTRRKDFVPPKVGADPLLRCVRFDCTVIREALLSLILGERLRPNPAEILKGK